MPLTPQEKQVGQRFRAEAEADLRRRNEADPPTLPVPSVLAVLRHSCAARHGRSTAMLLREIYLASPEQDGVAAGRWAYIFREGRCASCGVTARSDSGRLISGPDRPPLYGRVARS